MLDTVLTALIGAAIMGCLMGLYMYVPKVAAKVSAWWTKGKTEIAAVKADVASAHSKIDAVVADVAKLKAAGPATPAAS